MTGFTGEITSFAYAGTGFAGLIALLVLSLLVLAKSSEWVIKHAMVLAKFFRVSELAIGFLLVSVATSLPELFVSAIAALDKQFGIAVGNVLGSDIANIGMVLGASALIGTILVTRREYLQLSKILVLTSVLPLILLFELGSFAGIMLLAVFAGFAYYVLNSRIGFERHLEKVEAREAVVSALFFFAAIAIVVLSADAVVGSAVELAVLAGVSKTFVGATIIAAGTSFPELAVNIAGVRRKKYGLVLGNAIGSCVTNLTLVLGIAAVINPLAASLMPFTALVIFSIIINAVLWRFLEKGRLGRADGIALLLIYLIFILAIAIIEKSF